MRRKKERSKQGQTNNKAKQHSTPKAVTFPRKNELPQVGLEPTTLYIYIYIYTYVLSGAGMLYSALSGDTIGSIASVHIYIVMYLFIPWTYMY